MATKIYLNADELAKVNDVYTKAQTDTLLNSKADTSDLADKQDTLVSGTNIKTINNESVLGSGNITISSGSTDYDDLTDKPIINQDLDDGSFSPSANTYYRHIGASATTYTIGGIYYYDGTDFNLIDGSKGLTSVTASDVDSESATSGQVLQADGLGGASWQTPSTPTIEGTSVQSTGASNGQVLMADGTGQASWQNVPSGSSDVVIDIGTFHISKTATDIVNSLTSQQKTDIVDTSVNNVYIKVKNSIVNENALLKRTKYRIIDPDNNPNSENTEVCFVGSVVSDDYNQYNERYVLYYVIDYSNYPSSITEKALLYYTTLGSVNEIVANNSSIPMGNSIPFSNEFDYDFNNGYIKLSAEYVLSGTISNYDSIQDADAIATMVAHKPIIVNGKRFEYQDASGFHLRYFNASLNGTLIHLTIMDYNTDRNEVIFTEQDVNDGMTYTTTEPSAANQNGLMKLVVLDHDPATKYAGWLYYITQ